MGKRNAVLWFAILAAAALLGACQPVRRAPALSITLFKADDQAQTRWEGADLILDVSSPSGIGGMNLAWQGAFPSESLVVRLRLKGLEGLSVADETGAAALSVASSPPYEARNEAAAPDIAIQHGEGWFDVRLGPAWLQTGSLNVEWVDFYR